MSDEKEIPTTPTTEAARISRIIKANGMQHTCHKVNLQSVSEMFECCKQIKQANPETSIMLASTQDTKRDTTLNTNRNINRNLFIATIAPDHFGAALDAWLEYVANNISKTTKSSIRQSNIKVANLEFPVPHEPNNPNEPNDTIHLIKTITDLSLNYLRIHGLVVWNEIR
jgi:hypothetical protein